jgi:SAM-dependent methyltransferase
MPINWLDTKNLSFNSLLLLEGVQISWLKGLPAEVGPAMATALKANPTVAWYLKHKCSTISAWLKKISAMADPDNTPETIYAAEQKVLKTINDWLVYVVAPNIYDNQPFLKWDDQELTSLVEFEDKIVLDIGSGTGRLAFLAAQNAFAVYPVEPVANLRLFIKAKANDFGLNNIYPVDGLITDIPFHDNFADITMGGHIFGDTPEEERRELERVTSPGGMVILCPGNNDKDNYAHKVLTTNGYSWSRFKEPEDGWKRKYWKTI